MTSIYEWTDRALALPGAPEIWRTAADGYVVTVDTDEGLYGIAADGTWWEPTGLAGQRWVLAVDHPATAGCLLALLGPAPSEGYMAHVLPPSSAVTKWRVHMNTAHTGPLSAYGSTLGRACIAAAEALGRWPGGAPC